MMARKNSVRWQVATASTVALSLAAAALAGALITTAGIRADGRQLSQRLVPAATTGDDLLRLYSAQQAWLSSYVLTGHTSALVLFNDEAIQIGGEQDNLGRLVAAYGQMTGPFNAILAAAQAWLANIAGPQLAAMARGDTAAAQSLQANTTHVTSYVLAIRSAGALLDAQITHLQQMVSNQINQAQGRLLAALIVVCATVVAIVASTLAAVWLGMLRPYRVLRQATDAVAAGDYDTHIPVLGPSELADLGSGMELMRDRLVTALADRERAEQHIRSLVDAAPDAVIRVAADGSIAMANAKAADMFGYAVGDLIGHPVEMLVPEEAQQAMAAASADYFADPQSRPLGAELKLSGLRRDGRRFPAEVMISSMPTDSGMLVTASIRDVTERLALQSERKRLRAAAEQEKAERRSQQSQRLESLGQLVGGVAHDFNNLLNIIQGYADFSTEQVQALASADARLEPVVEDLGQVQVAAAQAIRLTRQLLTFARHEVNRPEVLDLNEAVKGAGQLLRRTLGEHIDLTITLEPALWRIKADRGQLEQVLVNLAVNARDAMPGGGRLVIDTANTEVDAAYASGRHELAPGHYARLRVSDTGFGMDRATAERVFEPFFSTKPKGRGTGLGLATVYGIVTQAGGSIEIYSEKGMGTTITVLLPITDEFAQPDLAPTVVGEDHRGHGETILVVEDEESLRELTSRMLMRNGYQVCVASGGAEAVRQASDSDQLVDLLLTDVVMPEMLGNEVAARVGAIRPGVPVLYMSGYAQPMLDAHGLPGTLF